MAPDRSAFGSPPQSSPLHAHSATQRDSLFAFGSGGSSTTHPQQHQQQAPPSGFGGLLGGPAGASQGVHHQSRAPPLGSGRGLETMPEDDDPTVRFALRIAVFEHSYKT